MSIMPISLGFSSNPGRAPAAGSARLLNCYAENAGKEQKAEWQIWAAPGLSEFARLTGGETIRAQIVVDDTLYVVSGRRIYAVDINGVETDLGGIATVGPVYMARNRKATPQIGIVSAGVYMVIEGGVLTTVSHPISAPTSIEFVDGFFVFSHADGRISHTESDDATTIDALAFGAVESSPDSCIRVIERQGEIIALGTKSSEFFGNEGSAPFAFGRKVAVNVGCAAAGSAAKVDQTVMFIADDNTVRILNGYTAQRVSTHAVERAILAEPDRADIVAVTWRYKGHTMYCISGSTFSYCYDLATQLWHDRKSYGLERWRISSVTEFNGDLIAGDYAANKLYRMSDDYGDEADAPLVVEITTPPVHAWPARVKFAALFLDMIPGVGKIYTPAQPKYLMWGASVLSWGASSLTWGDAVPEIGNIEDYDPVVMMRWSDDGGITWSAEHQRPIGKLAENQRRIVFRRLGASGHVGRVFQFRATASVMRGFLGCAAEAVKIAA